MVPFFFLNEYGHILTVLDTSASMWKNPSFYIVDDANGAIVDFAESEEEVNYKCVKAHSYGIKCTYHESSVKTFDTMREITKNLDLDPMKGDSIVIPNLDLREVPE